MAAASVNRGGTRGGAQQDDRPGGAIAAVSGAARDKKAIIAVGHTILVMVYHVLTRREPYRDLGANYFDEHDRQAVERRLVRRLEQLGLTVSIERAA